MIPASHYGQELLELCPEVVSMVEKTEKRGMCAGIAVGVIFFVLFGMIPGSFIGGVAGLKLAGAVFGFPLGSWLLPRIIVLVGMVMGLLLSALVIMFLSVGIWKFIGAVLGRPSGQTVAGALSDKMAAKE